VKSGRGAKLLLSCSVLLDHTGMTFIRVHLVQKGNYIVLYI
jgi:hypothetical protein